MFGIGFWEMLILGIIGLGMMGGIVTAIVILLVSSRKG